MSPQNHLEMVFKDRNHPLINEMHPCITCKKMKMWLFTIGVRKKDKECFECHIKTCKGVKMEIIKDMDV